MPADAHVTPFGPALSAVAAELPQVFRDQFLGRSRRVVLEGTMREIWHGPSWIAPLLWLSSRFEMLFPETGKDVPVTLVITALKHERRLAQRWRRTFRFGTRVRRFNSVVEFDPERGTLVELIGPARLLETHWTVAFLPPDKLEIESPSARLRLGPMRLPLPDFALGRVRAVQTADLPAPGEVTIEFVVEHPWLGPVFGYEGRFRVRHEAAS